MSPLLPRPRRLRGGSYWYGNVKLRTGQWKQFNTGCTARHAAEEVVRSVELEIAAGRDPFSRTRSLVGQTFAEAAESYLHDRRDDLSASTLVSRRSTFQRFAQLHPGARALYIGREEVAEFKDSLVGQLAPNSVNIHLRNLRALLNWQAEREPSYRPPKVRQVKAPGVEHRDSLTAAELHAVIQAADSYAINGRAVAPFFAFLALTGMRRGEALELLRGDIRGGWVYVSAKNKTGRKRLVPVTDELRRLVDSLPVAEGGRLFGNEFRDPSKLSKLFARSVRAAGIMRRLKLHNLRDTYIVAALVAGVPAAIVAQIVGNSVLVIERHYASLAEYELTRAREMLNAMPSITAILPERST